MNETIQAIQKFFYFSMNYQSRWYNWETIFGEKRTDYLPDFIMSVNWGCNRPHMIGKWMSIEDSDSYGRMNRFYAELDNRNRKALLEWVMANYNDEPKL